MAGEGGGESDPARIGEEQQRERHERRAAGEERLRSSREVDRRCAEEPAAALARSACGVGKDAASARGPTSTPIGTTARA